MSMTRIAIVGAGSWGTTLAEVAATKGNEVLLWSRSKEIAKEIESQRKNEHYLPGATLSKGIIATTELKDCCTAEIIIVAVPTPFFRDIVKKLSKHALPGGTVVVSAAKGLEEGSNKTMSQILEEELPGEVSIAALSGPNIAEEVIRKIPTATVISGKNKKSLEKVKDAFETETFKVYPLDDIIGTEVCGAVKNITALAIGVCDALSLGENAKGAIITLGLTEMAKVGRVFGAKRETCYGLAGVGDLVATCMSKHSRNRFVGEELGRGKSFAEINKSMHGMVAEGIKTAKAIHEFALQHKLDLPLTREVYQVFYEKKNIREAIKDLIRMI
ncbi:NAD(P)-dependent glycerol-3-phosphate dehydrogenase [Candidatus Woesearchaeota archaeon]|nr:NAD(P)-dependent glycerol-3-phosphate dehydrogenase [Candidatus Woesearchaeota archaeon]